MNLDKELLRLANQPHWETNDAEQKVIHQALRDLIASLKEQRCPTCNEDLMGCCTKREPGSADRV